MKRDAGRTYLAQKFAALAGVTVRTLHHYDRLGLLKPGRSASGYRLYQERDIERLEQIVALKFLGLSLQQIRKLLDRDHLELPDALRAQRRVLEEKKRFFEMAIKAIQEAERSLQPGRRPDSAVLTKIIEVIGMQDNMEWAAKYYSEEAREKIEERKRLWSPELQAQVSQQWTELFAEVEAALDEDPAGAKAQALADRWSKLVEGFTGGDPSITQGLSKLYSDRPNWPAAFRDRMANYSNPKVCDFIGRAFAARKR